MNTKAFNHKLWLASPTMHGEELAYIKEAYESNWMSTIGSNIDEIERMACEEIGTCYAVALSCGTAALHMAIRLAGEKAYGRVRNGGGTCCGKKVLCSDLTFSATVNPVVYEGGCPIFIDSEYHSWNMDPEALEKAFELYPDVKIVVCANLYGTPAKLEELAEICRKHDAILIEDAAESLGAIYKGRKTGSFGIYNVISFNGNKIITGSSGGMLLTDDAGAAEKARKWSTQSREKAPWYQHEELGYNYRMSNVIAGVVRGQFPHLREHIIRKKEIYERYREGFQNLPIVMNPYDCENSIPNFWLSCLLINKDAICTQIRDDCKCSYKKEKGKSCPTEILEALAEHNAEGRPIWKPMHMQPIFDGMPFITSSENVDVGADIFARGLCLPSDIKMTKEQQDMVIEVVRRCFV